MRNDPDVILEKKIITRCLLEGKNFKEIAAKLHCAKSTVSYKTRKLFNEFKAADRYEYVVNIFSEMIRKLKEKIIKLEVENEKLRGQNVSNNE